ncbi:MAG: FAD-dependent tricarballylate dehydrogenase TcuA [Chloroflexi bacterium]|nr:FAD-dependent tricarballylate dehydrogenase TcuA [Chloroflexota bacterium]
MAEATDIVVVGSGVAGLTAALSAVEGGATVLVVEKAPHSRRGGNGRFTGGGFRGVGPDYTERDFFNDLMDVSNNRADPELVSILTGRTAETIQWLTQIGMRWEPRDPGLYIGPGERSHPFALGGGEGLIDTLLSAAEKKGVKVIYETRATKLLLDGRGKIGGVRIKAPDGFSDIACKGVVLASGGFGSNAEMRVSYLRPDGDELKVRGTRHNTGEGLLMAMGVGAQPFGQFAGYDSTIMDARTPHVEGGPTNVYNSALTVIVNKSGKRFLDEGKDFHNKMHSYGRFMFNQQDHVAFCIFDSKNKEHMRYSPSDRFRFPPIEANTIEELARECEIDPSQLVRTLSEFNRAVQPGEFNPRIYDGKHAKGIEPPKSNWATTVDTPPYYAIPVTGGITFTFGGLKIDRDAQVIDVDDKSIPGLYATGEILGGFYYDFYLGQSGLTRGAVFGRIAGQTATR